MHSTSNAQKGAQIGDKNSGSTEQSYKVGPGRPPKEHQFKKGQSGNPKGAKRKTPPLALDLKQLLEQALDRKITLTQGERTRTLSLFEAGVQQLAAQFAKGDRHARREVFEIAPKLGIDLWGTQKTLIEEALKADQLAILNDYLLKQYDRLPPRTPVLAPADLLDDDVDDETKH